MADVSPSDDALNIALPANADANRHTHWFLIAFYGIAMVWGLRNVWFWEPSTLDLLIPVVFAICLGWWALVDARRRKHHIPTLSRVWFFFLAGIVVPAYVIWSRGWRGFAWVVLHSLCWYALATFVMHSGGTIVFGAEWWRAMGA